MGQNRVVAYKVGLYSRKSPSQEELGKMNWFGAWYKKNIARRSKTLSILSKLKYK